MATRLPASQRTREGLTALIEGRLSTSSAKDELVKLATRLIVEEALEGEAGDAVGRDYYEHGAQPGQGYRNGYRTGRLKTAEGLMEYSTPQIAGRDEPFRSAIREHLKGHTQGLEDLAIEMLARGLSVRDIEDAFKDESGRLLLSKTAVSQLGERLWEDYRAFAKRDLSEYEISYLFIDGIAERLRPGAKREPVLAAWGYTVEGRRVLLHLMAGSKEDAETVTAFFEDMKMRGLNDRWHPGRGRTSNSLRKPRTSRRRDRRGPTLARGAREQSHGERRGYRTAQRMQSAKGEHDTVARVPRPPTSSKP